MICVDDVPPILLSVEHYLSGLGYCTRFGFAVLPRVLVFDAEPPPDLGYGIIPITTYGHKDVCQIYVLDGQLVVFTNRVRVLFSLWDPDMFGKVAEVIRSWAR